VCKELLTSIGYCVFNRKYLKWNCNKRQRKKIICNIIKTVKIQHGPVYQYECLTRSITKHCGLGEFHKLYNKLYCQIH